MLREEKEEKNDRERQLQLNTNALGHHLARRRRVGRVFEPACRVTPGKLYALIGGKEAARVWLKKHSAAFFFPLARRDNGRGARARVRARTEHALWPAGQAKRACQGHRADQKMALLLAWIQRHHEALNTLGFLV